LDAHVDEQRREKAEARVPFLLVSFLWARKEKTLAYRRNKMLNQRAELSKEIPTRTITDRASLTLRGLHSLCNQRKVNRRGAKENAETEHRTNSTEPSKELPIRTSQPIHP
jgi:hypothetical protein